MTPPLRAVICPSVLGQAAADAPPCDPSQWLQCSVASVAAAPSPPPRGDPTAQPAPATAAPSQGGATGTAAAAVAPLLLAVSLGRGDLRLVQVPAGRDDDGGDALAAATVSNTVHPLRPPAPMLGARALVVEAAYMAPGGEGPRVAPLGCCRPGDADTRPHLN